VVWVMRWMEELDFLREFYCCFRVGTRVYRGFRVFIRRFLGS